MIWLPADIIAQAVRMFSGMEGAGRVGEIAVSKLTAAGYRILAPGELDPETLERCAEEANGVEPDLLKSRTEAYTTIYCRARVDAATAIRSLSKEGA